MFATYNVSVMNVAIREKTTKVRLMTFKREWRGGVDCQSALFSLTQVSAVIVSMFRITPNVIYN